MASDINRVVLIGNLTRDAELKYTSGGTAICKFSIANNRRRKQGDDWIDEVNYFDFVMFGRRAEGVSRYLSKGTRVAVEGQLRQDRWQDSEGQNRSRVETVVDNIQFLSGGTGGSSAQGSTGGNTSGQAESPSGPPSGKDVPQSSDFDDDIPF
ncbi:MAG: single-stranded DNA-binding protein [Spirochaetales bacterium]|nr:single-stranded DNA-binding protein [Spirochaetales bacterium]MCF7937488.1 single-stranded DNA-binding protein [Spirochaetales bacterium]